MVSASEYAKRKGDNCQPKAFTYRLTTESLPNETTETVGPILHDLIDLRYMKNATETHSLQLGPSGIISSKDLNAPLYR